MKSRRTTRFTFAACFVLALQAQIAAPRVGVARYPEGALRTISGLEANFIVSDYLLPSADTVSFSDSCGLVSVDGNIRLIGPKTSVIAEYDSGEIAPVLNVDGDATTAIVWLPSRQMLVHWDGKFFAETQVADGVISGQVTSLRVQSTSARLLVLAADGHVSEATVNLITGNLTSLDVLPGAVGLAFRHHSFLLFHDQKGLEIESSKGAVRTIPLPARDLTFERMSSDWVHLSSPSARRDWALHLNSATLHLSELPEPQRQ